MKLPNCICVAIAAMTLTAAVAPAQRAPALPTNAADQTAQDARFTAWRQHPLPGTGPFTATRVEEPSIPTHTIYRPVDLDSVKGKLPIVAFGNGGCRNTSIEFTAFLAEIASRGYFVVAAGRNDVEFGLGDGKSANGMPLQVSDASILTHAVDWAIAENDRAGSPYHGRLDTKAIAYMGQSCGGIQALTASLDPRTKTTVVLNSAYIDNLPPNMPKGALPEQLPYSSLHAPIAFFIGGKTDVAYPYAKKAFGEIATLPVFIANLDVGHTGAYPAPDMRWVDAVLSWLQWQLRGNLAAARQFRGADCGLCANSAWTEVASKNLR